MTWPHKPEAHPGNAGRADYPRMLYKDDGRTTVVNTAAEHDALMKEGWDTLPSPIHSRVKPTPSPTGTGWEPLARLIRETIEAVLDERGIHKVSDKGDDHHGERKLKTERHPYR